MKTLLKFFSYGALGVLVLILITATLLEKLFGSSIVLQYLYTSPWIIMLWTILTLSAISYIVMSRMKILSFTFLIHFAFALILAGALVTHIFGRQGRMHLFENSPPKSNYISYDGRIKELPFKVSLNSFTLKYYRGTFAPMDYVSSITIDDGKETKGELSINNTFYYKGWRFQQSGYDNDQRGATIAISHDPYGKGITYSGYLLLLLSLIGFFLQKKSHFRTLLKSPLLQRSKVTILLLLVAIGASATPKTLPKDVAEKFGNLYVYYNERICPMQTLAKDFTNKLYEKEQYNGLTAEQVFTGWLFYYYEWEQEPIIAIKGKALRKILGISGNYASLKDFSDEKGYKLSDILTSSINKPLRRAAESANEKFNLVAMLCNGDIMRMFPVTHSDKMTMWYSLAYSLPKEETRENFVNMQKVMKRFSESIFNEKYDEAKLQLDTLRIMQAEEASHILPDNYHFKIEKIYNSADITGILAILCAALGVLSFTLYTRKLISGENKRPRLHRALTLITSGVFVYLVIYYTLRGYIGNHLPLSNGYEAMLFTAIVSLAITLFTRKRFFMALPLGLLIGGVSLMVATMGSSNPQITHLTPELHSPLLSIHVVFIMIAYALFAFAMLNGITALFLYKKSNSYKKIEYLALISRLILYPALFLLIGGIFIGAIWADASWGRYWGWDAKEVWALITMLVYSLTMHSNQLPFIRHPFYFHIFCIVAFATVLITYFGVNLLFSSIHSYA